MLSWSNQKPRTIYVATNAELLNNHYYLRLWMAVKNMTIPRRDWLDELADTFRDATDIEILNRSGEPYDLPEVDDIFDDPDMRWLTDFLKANSSGNKPSIKSSKIERLRMLDLYYRVKHPNIANHFTR